MISVGRRPGRFKKSFNFVRIGSWPLLVPRISKHSVWIGSRRISRSSFILQSEWSDLTTPDMSSELEDKFYATNKYTWSEKSDSTLQDYLTKFKPSMVQNDGTKPWIWVHGSGAPLKENSEVDEREAQVEAGMLLKEVTARIEDIKNDDSIPLRSNKKTGAKSKKEIREQLQADTTVKIKEIAIKHGYVVGKWLLFAPPDKVDMIWSSIATSLVSGPLSSTSAYLAKVATSPAQETANFQHLICVYIPDVYDKASVTEVMRVLLRNHGANLSGVKSDLYTMIGIDSKHPSGISSTVWKNNAIFSEKESKELKDAFFAEVGQNKPAPIDNPAENNAENNTENNAPIPKVATTSTKGKGRPRLKKKTADDPFISDNDGHEDDTVGASKDSTVELKRPNNDEDEEEGKSKKKRVT